MIHESLFFQQAKAAWISKNTVKGIHKRDGDGVEDKNSDGDGE